MTNHQQAARAHHARRRAARQTAALEHAAQRLADAAARALSWLGENDATEDLASELAAAILDVRRALNHEEPK
jgi:hypothetical protein